MTERYMPIQEKEVRPQVIGWLGPSGTFTEKAAKRMQVKIGEKGKQRVILAPDYSKSIAALFQELNEDKRDIVVVPIENTLGGPVNDTHLALQEIEGITIIKEVVLPIRQYFYCLDRSRVTTIASKDQAIFQSSKWIKSNFPTASILEVDSTSLAVQIAAKDPSFGAIAGEYTASELGLQDRLKRTEQSIENNKTNATTFVAIAKTSELSEPTGNDKTTFILEIPNRAGSLYSLLTSLAEKGINLTKIKSLTKVEGIVRFLISIDGHQKEEPVQFALASLLNNGAKIKMLGSYPKDDYIPEYTMEADMENAIRTIRNQVQNGDGNNKNKSTVVFALPNEVGSLANALKVFAERKINLTKIDSLPSGNFGEYIFYLEFDNKDVVNKDVLIQKLSSRCTQLVLLHR